MKSRVMAGFAGLLIFVSSAALGQTQNGQTQYDSTLDDQNNQVQNDQSQGDQSQYDQLQNDPGQSDSQSDTQSGQYSTDQNQNVPAQAEPSQAEQAQTLRAQNDHSVARVSLIHGDVTTQRGDSGDWSSAVLNQPMVSGDRLATGARGRAELQLDHANILRVGERTQANIASLTRNAIQVQIGRGIANLSVLRDSDSDVQIDTPNLSVHPGRRDVSVRITVISDDESQVMVRRGDVDISTPQGSTHLRSGQLITVRGTGSSTQYKVGDAMAQDDFDRWIIDRDHVITSAQSWNRTNQYYVGSEDLDNNGHWTSVPDYGQVWVPSVDADWAPYRAGQWVWEPFWGWTWVSYEPWGWAPYHYGRWFLYGSSWAWWPGPIYGGFYRPIWAPAYVSFYGFGGGFGFGFGSVGWLPIGPCDRFFPWWGGYRGRFHTFGARNFSFNRGGFAPLHRGTTFSNIRMASFNNRMRGSISSVRSGDFGRGRVSIHPVSREMFNSGHRVAGNVPVVPNRQSLSAGQRRSAPSGVRTGSQHFFGNTRTAARSQGFNREAADVRDAINRNGRSSTVSGNSRSGVNESRSGSFGRGAGSNTRAGDSVNRNSNPSWRNSGQSGRQGGSPNVTSNTGSNRPSAGPSADWRRMPGQGQGNSRSMGGNAPMTRNRAGNGSIPAQNGGDWRRTMPTQERNSPPATQRDSGNWRQNNPRESGNRGYSRPSLDMRQPIVTPRNSGPGGYRGGSPGGYRGYPGGSSGGYRGAPSGNPRGYSGPSASPRGYSGPSGGGYRGGGGGGGGHSAPAPSHGGGGGGGHSSHGSGGGGGSRHR